MNTKMKDTKLNMAPSEHISQEFSSYKDWRGDVLNRVRKVVHEADPAISEEWKWGTAVWTHQGMVCGAAAFKDHVKVNFFKGASLNDPDGLFNAGLDAKDSRGIDFHEGEDIDETKLKALIRRAVDHNLG